MKWRVTAQLMLSRSFSSKLFVKGISFTSTQKTITEAFLEFGQVTDVQVIMDKKRNRPKGYAFVTFATEEGSRKALMEMNGKVLDGRCISVSE